jgi:hypothetical protein
MARRTHDLPDGDALALGHLHALVARRLKLTHYHCQRRAG